MLTVSLIVVIAILAWSLQSTGNPPGATCTAGDITVSGSTAFTSAADKVAASYQNVCSSSNIRVNPSGSETGSFAAVNALKTDVGADSTLRNKRMAMSDGKPEGDYQNLGMRPVAIVVFSVVVNKKTGVSSLTTEQLRRIYSGAITNWSDPALGGNNLPISIIGREDTSGTRNTFDQKVLGNAQELQPTSNDCRTRKDKAPTGVLQCVVTTTDELLKQVNTIDGAIGYADLVTTSSQQPTYSNVVQAQVNNRDATVDLAKNNQYPFWAVEYMYTYGSPATDTLLSSFLTYLTKSDTAKKIMLSDGHYPCLDDQQNVIDLCKEQ
jgi:ABC-type phosphate transport system substrate-binding protein